MRCFDRRNVIELAGGPATGVVREVLQSALHMARLALDQVGLSAEQVERAEARWRESDRERLAVQIEGGDIHAAETAEPRPYAAIARRGGAQRGRLAQHPQQMLLRRHHRQRPGEQIALAAIHAQFAHHCAFGCGLDPLRHHLAAGFARELHHRCGNRAAGRVAVDIAGDGHVDLDDIGLEIEHVAQAGIAGADIVDGDARMRAQRIERGGEGIIILHILRLGHLDHQIGRTMGLKRAQQFTGQDGARAGIDGGIEALRQLCQRFQRAGHCGHFQLGAQADQLGILEPGFRPALVDIGKAGEAFHPNRLAAGQIMDRLLEHADRLPVKHAGNPAARLFVAHVAFQRAFDPFGDQPGKAFQDRQVTFGHGPVRLARQRAEAAPHGAVGQPQGGVEVAADRQEFGDSQRRGKGVIGRIADQFGQHAIEDVPAIARPRAVRESPAPIGSSRSVLTWVSSRCFILDIARDEGNLHAQMAAHRSQDAFDARVLHQLEGSGGAAASKAGRSRAGMGMAPLVRQKP